LNANFFTLEDVMKTMRTHFIERLKERVVREVGYGLSLEGASSADPVKSRQTVRRADLRFEKKAV
jgi:hypothetical protein